MAGLVQCLDEFHSGKHFRDLVGVRRIVEIRVALQFVLAFPAGPDFFGNSGKVGYVVYSQDLTDDQLGDYLRAHAGNAEFGKKINHGLVDLGSLSAGDRVGFFLERNNGDTIYTTAFATKHGTDYLDFTKNGTGSSKDEWMSISNVKAVGHVTAGGPLPGVLAVLLIGGLGAGSMKLRKRRA